MVVDKKKAANKGPAKYPMIERGTTMNPEEQRLKEARDNKSTEFQRLLQDLR